ncbi:MAG: type II secretion system F family protein [Candidatus Pacearchaeota archaeon]
MEFGKKEKIGLIVGIAIAGLAFFFQDSIWFTIMIGAGLITAASPFVWSTVVQSRIEKEKENMFLEFARNLVESVKMGSPISKSILVLRKRDYGALNPYISKLSNQLSMGVPLNKALQTFSYDVGNKKISQAITLIRQAERAGGHIGEILESVTEAVSMADKLKKERRSKISSLMIQGYIIFFVFMIIILVIQFQILPMLSGISGLTSLQGGTSLSTSTTETSSGIGEGSDSGSSSAGGLDPKKVADAFLNLLLVQGLFSGLIIGKLAEGNIKYGVKHSFILMISAFVVSTGANALFGA